MMRRIRQLLRFLLAADHFLVVGLTVLTVVLLSVITVKTPALNPIAKGLRNFSATDLFFSLENRWNEPDTCRDIVIVDMTPLHSRSDIASLLSEVAAAKPKAIGVDLIFEGEKDDTDGNISLEQAVEQAAPLCVFANKLTDYNPSAKRFEGMVSSYFCDFIPISEGYANVTDDMEKSTLRELTVTQQSVLGEQQSMVAHLARKAGARIEGKKGIVINYGARAFRVIPFDKVRESSNLIKGNIALVGTMTEEQDMHLTPLGKMAGVEVQAYSLLTLLEHSDIVYAPWAVAIAVALLLCYIYELLFAAMALLVARCGARSQIFLTESRLLLTLLSTLYVTAVTLLSYYVFEAFNVYVDMVTVLLLVAFVGLSRRLYFAAKKSIMYKPNQKTV